MKYLKQAFLWGMLIISGCSGEDSADADFSAGGNSSNGNGGFSGDGATGSLSKFTLGGNHLYVLNSQSLVSYDISEKNNPKKSDEIYLGLGIETVMTRGNNLFIGTTTGMHIFDISVPSQPQKLSTYEHVYSCDPVALSGDYAYVTLRSGTGCFRGENRLDIVDISNLRNPTLKNSIIMTNPHGLGTDADDLFVTEGSSGLIRFDISDKINPKLEYKITDIHAVDVIPNSGVLVVTGNLEVVQYQYNLEDGVSMNELSTLKF